MKFLAFLLFAFAIVAPSVQIPASYYNKTSNETTSAKEQTLIILKPDTLQRGLIADVLKRFEVKGLKLTAIKMLRPSRELVEVHYKQLRNQSFYGSVISYMCSGPIILTVWEGYNAVSHSRKIKGDTINPLPGTIRFDYSMLPSRNIVHGSHTVEDAKREISIWFNENELIPWEQANVQYIHGDL